MASNKCHLLSQQPLLNVDWAQREREGEVGTILRKRERKVGPILPGRVYWPCDQVSASVGLHWGLN